MDLQKKLTFIKWLNVLGEQPVNDFSSLQDGQIIVNVLQTCGDHVFPDDVALDTAEQRIHALKAYLEGFYHQSFDDGQLINFNLLRKQNIVGDAFELEMGKMLLAILGCVIQDKCRERFVEAALGMDEASQYELKEMIENVLFMNDGMDTQLPRGFADILRQKRTSDSNPDVLSFFQLVGSAGIAESPRASPVPTPGSTPQPCGPAFTMFSNSPQGANTSGVNLRDISSPLRMMSLSSPQTPLGALIHSPKLAQKALLRQKMQEHRQLEIALRNEQHLRQELELDLQDRTSQVQDRENRVRELERQLSDLRRMRDSMDELEMLRVEVDKLQRDNKELHSRMLEHHDVREQCQILDKENQELTKDLTAAREELKLFESSRTASEEFRVQCHRLQLSNTELATSLQHREEEVSRLRQSLEEAESSRQVLAAQRDSLRREKEELEEMYCQASVCSQPLGESMNVVTEKRLAEVQGELDNIRSSWIDPGQHEAIRQQLSVEQQTKQSYEEKYFEARKKLLSLEESLETSNLKLRQSQTQVGQLETNVSTAKDEARTLQGQVSELTAALTQLEHSEAELTQARSKCDERITSLVQELTQLQSQLQLSAKELDHEREVTSKCNTTIQALEADKKTLEHDLQAQQECSEKVKVDMDHEISVLKDKISAVEEDNKIVMQQLGIAKKDSSEQVAQTEALLNDVKETAAERLEKLQSLNQELEDLKTFSEKKVKELNDQLQNAKKGKSEAEKELHKLGLEFENTKTSFESKKRKLETMSKETETSLTQKNEHLENSNRHLNEQCQTLKKELKTSTAMVETQKEEKSALRRELEQIQRQGMELNTCYEQAQTKIVAYESKMAALVENVKEGVEANTCLENEKKSLIEKFNVTNKELNDQIRKQSEDMANNLEKYETDLNATRKEFEEQISVLKREHADIVNKLNTELEEVNSSTEKLKECHESSINEYKATIDSKQSEIMELELSVKEKMAKLDSMSQQTDYLKDTEKSLRTALSMINTDYDTMKNLIAERDQAKLELEKAISLKEAEISNLKANLDNLQTEFETEKNDQKTEINALKATFNDQESQKGNEISSLSEIIERLKKDLDESKADFKTTTDSMKGDFESTLAEKEEKVKVLLQEAEKLRAAREEDKKNGAAKLDELKMNLENRLFEKNAELIVHREETAEKETIMKTKCEELQSQIEHLQGELAKSAETVGQNDKAMAEYQNRIVETESYWRSQCEELQEEYANETREQKEEMARQLEELESKHSDVILKINNDSEVHVASLEEGYRQKIQGLERALADKREANEKLSNTIEEQRTSYQEMMSEMEGKLNEEIKNLNNRLSQMKCQYETMMESKEKETKKKMHEFTEKVNELEKDKTQLSEHIKQLEEEIEKLKTEIAAHVGKISDCEGMLSETNSLQTEREEKIVDLEAQVAAAREEVRTEKGENGELQRQLQYNQERNDTLSAELSSQQQQLAAVEEEKRQLELQLSSVQEGRHCDLEQLQGQHDTEHRHWTMEKMELENQLQSLQKSYSAVEKTAGELQAQLDEDSAHRSRAESRCADLERQLCTAQQREGTLRDDAQSLREANIKMNGQQELQKAEFEKLTAQLMAAQKDLGAMQSKFEADTRSLLEEKTVLEIQAARLDQVEKELALKDEEHKKASKLNEQYKTHYNLKKERIAELEKQVKAHQQTIETAHALEEKYAARVTPLQDQLNLEIAKNKGLAKKIQALEVQNDYAERKLREYKQELSKASSVFLGDPSDFHQVMRERDNDADATFMHNYPSSVPSSNDSMFEDNHKRASSLDDTTPSSGSLSEDNTVLSRPTRRSLRKSTSSNIVAASADNADTVSIGSATSLAYRLRSRESAASLNRSISSFDSIRSTTSVPRGTGGIFHCEDEPMELEWGRLGELSRRNTMCPNHLKTSYPVETQRYNPRKFQDNALRESTIGNSLAMSNKDLTGSGKKRKQAFETESGSDSSDSKSKLAKTAGTVYQKPGPPTPANQRRNSKGSKSPNSRRSSKGSRSPRTPQLRHRKSPRRTPRRTPQSGLAMDTGETGRQASRRESVAFSVGFSPVSQGHPTRLSRQRAFIQKQPPSSSQVPTRKPLGVRNYQQTGV